MFQKFQMKLQKKLQSIKYLQKLFRKLFQQLLMNLKLVQLLKMFQPHQLFQRTLQEPKQQPLWTLEHKKRPPMSHSTPTVQYSAFRRSWNSR